MVIQLEIKSCRECPFFKRERVYTADSWEEVYEWTCTKTGNKIASYVEWREAEDIKIPEWCPIKAKP